MCRSEPEHTVCIPVCWPCDTGLQQNLSGPLGDAGRLDRDYVGGKREFYTVLRTVIVNIMKKGSTVLPISRRQGPIHPSLGSSGNHWQCCQASIVSAAMTKSPLMRWVLSPNGQRPPSIFPEVQPCDKRVLSLSPSPALLPSGETQQGTPRLGRVGKFKVRLSRQIPAPVGSLASLQ